MRTEQQKDVIAWLDKAATLRALVIGEPIIDEYIFVSPEGKSPKDSIVCFRRLRSEQYEGGASVIAGHLRAVCGTVEQEHYGTSPVLKRRYVLEPFMTKLFEVANITGTLTRQPLSPIDGRFDFIVVADYGHGLLRNADVEYLARTAPYLVLMVQSNSLNFGYNLLTKWPRADYVVCDEDELRLACHDRDSNLMTLAQQQRRWLKAKLLVVTMGHKGCLVCAEDGIAEIPSFAHKVLDRTGAGDAFLAASAPIAFLGAPAQVVGIVGSMAAALKVETLGNKPIDRKVLRERLEAEWH